ncbi:two-partner secretion domain-containing protein [Caballeronia humi]|uniref:Filamentous hemagglutinin outer membrane protein n=1 Tax=Caballeronia humi TaxID=326474 RepID=A0A158H935_9BURK|nr:filamentous hemagglutinin N-terminal domain-containing protein [Caballeronia humi]SAL40818.1 filamentous hemagglutinin outer membrane protein [Caballeronia humi]
MKHSSNAHHLAPSKCTKLTAALMLAAGPAILAFHAPIASAQALTAAGGAGNRPAIAVAANRTPVVNIVAPNAAGVSHNKFTDYNVGAAGLVLNNSNKIVQSQLAGRVAGNTQLGATPAKVILNEVTGANASNLNGATEIAGGAAHLIVANPNGITANGAGFINATRATLTTGQARFDAVGNIASIDTTTGRIDIQGKGLNARNVDQLDLIARSIEVNAAVQARKLVGVAGVTRQNLGTDTTTIGSNIGLKGEGPAPVVAIDVSQLGSMYADSIRLVGSADGLGVNGNGAARTSIVAPQQGMIGGTVNIGGKVVANSSAAVSGRKVNIAKTGVLSATGQNLSIAGDVRNEGLLSANTAMSVNGALDNRGGQLTTGRQGTLAVSGEALNSDNGKMTIGSGTFSQSLENRSGEVRANGALKVARDLDNFHGSINTTGDIGIGGDLMNEESTVATKGSLKVGGYAWNEGGRIFVGRDVSIKHLVGRGISMPSVTGDAPVAVAQDGFQFIPTGRPVTGAPVVVVDTRPAPVGTPTARPVPPVVVDIRPAPVGTPATRPVPPVVVDIRPMPPVSSKPVTTASR